MSAALLRAGGRLLQWLTQPLTHSLLPGTNVVAQAWEKKKGTTKEAAMAAYIALVATLS